MVVIIVMDEGKPIGYTINEILDNTYYMGHFGKADYNYHGVNQYLEHVTAKHMKAKGVSHMNMQQDLGIDHLKQSKSSWRPVNKLKKYIIKSK
jgi:hypothetical protein